MFAPTVAGDLVIEFLVMVFAVYVLKLTSVPIVRSMVFLTSVFPPDVNYDATVKMPPVTERVENGLTYPLNRNTNLVPDGQFEAHSKSALST